MPGKGPYVIPCCYRIIPHLNLALFVHSGQVTLPEALAVFVGIESDPDWTGGLNEIDDYSHVTGIEFNASQATRLGELAARVLDRNDAHKKNALIAPTPFARSLARHMFDQIDTSGNSVAMIVSSLTEALAFVGLNPVRNELPVARTIAEMRSALAPR